MSEGTRWFQVTLLSAAFATILDMPTHEARMMSSTLDTKAASGFKNQGRYRRCTGEATTGNISRYAPANRDKCKFIPNL